MGLKLLHLWRFIGPKPKGSGTTGTTGTTNSNKLSLFELNQEILRVGERRASQLPCHHYFWHKRNLRKLQSMVPKDSRPVSFQNHKATIRHLANGHILTLQDREASHFSSLHDLTLRIPPVIQHAMIAWKIPPFFLMVFLVKHPFISGTSHL